MAKFAIPFEIIGALKIEAADAAEAQAVFERMNVDEIASEGSLESFEPEPVGDDN